MSDFLIYGSDIDDIKSLFDTSFTEFNTGVEACKKSIMDFIQMPSADFSGETVRKLSI